MQEAVFVRVRYLFYSSERHSSATAGRATLLVAPNCVWTFARMRVLPRVRLAFVAPE